jgi:hypothetical protein
MILISKRISLVVKPSDHFKYCPFPNVTSF